MIFIFVNYSFRRFYTIFVVMESLIPIISKLQDVFSTIGYRDTDVQLPQIVVIGSQVCRCMSGCNENTCTYFLSKIEKIEVSKLKIKGKNF